MWMAGPVWIAGGFADSVILTASKESNRQDAGDANPIKKAAIIAQER
jgi:hypothetical protein